jgi:hypothetical protein
MPVVVLMPIGTATPLGRVALSTSPSSAPGSTMTLRPSWLSRTARRRPWSITTPPSTSALPDTLCPPPLIETGRPASVAKASARRESSSVAHLATRAGRRSIIRFQMLRLAS